MKQLEKALVDAALELAGATCAHQFSIPVPNTTPRMFVTLSEGIPALAASQPAAHALKDATGTFATAEELFAAMGASANEGESVDGDRFAYLLDEYYTTSTERTAGELSASYKAIVAYIDAHTARKCAEARESVANILQVDLVAGRYHAHVGVHLDTVARDIVRYQDLEDTLRARIKELEAPLKAAEAAARDPVAHPIYYMRDNHTFRPLSEDVEKALAEIGEEFDAGQPYGLLGTKRKGAPKSINAGSQKEREEFLVRARAWLEETVVKKG